MIGKGRPFRGPRTTALVLALGASIFALLHDTPPPQLFPQSDKLLHLLLFAILAAGCDLIAHSRALRQFLLIAILLLACGSELLQATPWLPRRTFSLGDIAANLLGTGLGVFAARRLIHPYARAAAHHPLVRQFQGQLSALLSQKRLPTDAAHPSRSNAVSRI